jgi:hypothetical protein
MLAIPTAFARSRHFVCKFAVELHSIDKLAGLREADGDGVSSRSGRGALPRSTPEGMQ